MTVEKRRLAELAEFLRARRARLRPEEVGLPVGERRRPGLRRAEVAELAGISAAWYASLEQGRDVRPSSEVLEGLVRALRLSTGERERLFSLALNFTPPTLSPALVPDVAVQRVLAALDPTPALVLDPRLDVVAWNDAAARLLTDFGAMPGDRRNLLWWLVTDPSAHDVVADWEGETRAWLARFQVAAGNHVDDPGFGVLISDLYAASAQVRAWWGTAKPPRGHRNIRLRHKKVGEFVLDTAELTLVGSPVLTLVAYTAAAGSPSAHRLAALAERGH